MVFEDQKEVQGVSPEGKKPYRKPELQVYGDLSSITGTHDNGHPTADNATMLTKT